MNKIETAFQLFDSYNRQDPHVFTWKGEGYPQEYFLAHALYGWVLKLNPQAGENLLLASRCQHIGRWESPRENYPEGRDGYLAWRRDLARFHAEKAAGFLMQAGYGEEQIAEVQRILLKKKIKVDPEVQVMENALCLVFLEFQYEDFFPKYEDDKVVNIIKKSLMKMDAQGHAFALKLNYPAKGLDLIQRALKELSV